MKYKAGFILFTKYLNCVAAGVQLNSIIINPTFIPAYFLLGIHVFLIVVMHKQYVYIKGQLEANKTVS